jgi:predicted transcriptional regulator of viral defense system
MASRSVPKIAPRPLRRLDELVDTLHSHGRYTFTRAEALGTLGTTAESLKKAVQGLTRKRRLASPRRGFYVVVPAEYRVAGAPPAAWYIDAFMKAIGTPYYVGVLTAAALHGAAPQQPQEFQVVTTRKERPVTIGRERVRFLKKRRLTRSAAVPVKTPTGTMLVSTPETTALDLLRYPEAAGFLSNIAGVLRELAPKCDPVKLVEASVDVEWPQVQRLGYLLDRVGARALAEPLARRVAEQRPGWARLEPGGHRRKSARDERWRLLVNARVQADR